MRVTTRLRRPRGDGCRQHVYFDTCVKPSLVGHASVWGCLLGRFGCSLPGCSTYGMGKLRCISGRWICQSGSRCLACPRLLLLDQHMQWRRLTSGKPPMRSKGQSCPNNRAPAEERFEKWRGEKCMHTVFSVYNTASKTATLRQFSRSNPATRPVGGPAWDHAHCMGSR